MAFHEWWCPHCRVSHPPGRKVCVHCGGRVLPSRDAATAFDPRAVLRLPGAGGEDAAPAEEAEAAESRGGRTARFGMTLVWVALAIGASLLRMCQERG